MKGFVQDIEGLAVKNTEFRRVLYTAKNCQLVVMALKPKEEIGVEVHQLDQFFRVEAGTGNVPLKLYTLYAPPNHRDGVVHHTRIDALAHGIGHILGNHTDGRNVFEFIIFHQVAYFGDGAELRIREDVRDAL